MHDIRRRDVEPAMRAIRYLCRLQMPRWSILVAPMCYVLFVLCVLNASFPLRSWAAERRQQAAAEATASVAFRVISDRKYTSKELEKLKAAFNSADTNKDGSLRASELEKYIHKSIVRHIQMGIRLNPICFQRIDTDPRDGLVTWDEYHAYFLRQKGVPESYIASHANWIDDSQVPLDRLAKDELMRDKVQWEEAARTDSMSLTLDEFLAFRHPEASAVNLLSMVDDLLHQFDRNGDDVLQRDEFTHVVADDLDDKWREYVVNKTVLERDAEFRRLMDLDRNGRADRSELLNYIDPRNVRFSRDEAKFLIEMADGNGDQQLTWTEMFAHVGVFVESKLLGRPESFHDAY